VARRRLRAFSFAYPRELLTLATGPVLHQIDEAPPDQYASTEQFVRWTLDRFRDRTLVLTTSFGMEGCALIDMYARQGGTPTVVYLDTMFFYPETYALRDRMVQRYPGISFVNRGTSLTPEDQEQRYGAELWRRNPDLCCSLRKVEPLRQALDGVDAWISAITRSQSQSRSGTPLVAWDWQFQVLKICPLATWDRSQIWEYVRRHDVPFNELHERGYPTIGCTHCTTAVPGLSPAEYSRAGRWVGTDKTECGLHELRVEGRGVEGRESRVEGQRSRVDGRASRNSGSFRRDSGSFRRDSGSHRCQSRP
jgi:phosphoadenosine phosphosulfate reductase